MDEICSWQDKQASLSLQYGLNIDMIILEASLFASTESYKYYFRYPNIGSHFTAPLESYSNNKNTTNGFIFEIWASIIIAAW